MAERCELCKFAKIPEDENGEVDLDEYLFCEKHFRDVEDEHICPDFEMSVDIKSDIKNGLIDE